MKENVSGCFFLNTVYITHNTDMTDKVIWSHELINSYDFDGARLRLKTDDQKFIRGSMPYKRGVVTSPVTTFLPCCCRTFDQDFAQI